jgi:hypothetical protein
MADKNWIQNAIKREGALRKIAQRLGLIRGDEKLSPSDLRELKRHAKETDNTRLMKQVNLAMTLREINKKRRK